MLARRFSCPPVQEALYEPRKVPNTARDMEGTVIVRPSREEWLSLLGEMTQMTNEAVRRRASSARDASKPLSLEYMADRMDVDDPLFGYLAVTKETGWMQGYVTCTTFTTWHRGFRWDSLNPVLDLHTAPHHAAATPAKAKSAAGAPSPNSSEATATGSAEGANGAPRKGPKVDEDGSLSTDLQREMYAGDPDNDGIQWPRIAELSLLGALGCGRWLVQLILDGLEAPDSPYRYVVTQATDGSIPFYERMGFVRVGCVTRTKRAGAEPADADAAAGKRKRSSSGGGSGGGGGRAATAAAAAAAAVAAESGDVIARRFEHVCENGETCATVAARHGVETFDLLFLNQRKFGPHLHKDTPFKTGTRLQVPSQLSVAEVREEESSTRQTWHVLTEESTLKAVGTLLNIPPRELLELNRGTIKGLQASVRLRGARRARLRRARLRLVWLLSGCRRVCGCGACRGGENAAKP